VVPLEHRVDLASLRASARRNTAQALAGATGGATLFVRTPVKDVAIAKLGAEMHAQYVLSFVPRPRLRATTIWKVRLARNGKVPHPLTARPTDARRSQ